MNRMHAVIMVPLAAALLFSRCDTGLALPNSPSGFSGIKRFTNWPPPDSVLDLRLVAFEAYPSDSTSIIGSVLSGKAVVYPIIGRPALSYLSDAAAYRLTNEGTTPHASAGRGFRMPSVAEMSLSGEVSTRVAAPNAGLNPERSWACEVGILQRLEDWGKFECAAFQSNLADLIEAGLIVSSEDLPFIQWQDVTRARVRGFEASLGIGFFRGDLTWNAGYTFVCPQDITVNDILKYRPRHLLHTTVQARVGPLTGGIDFRYISRVKKTDEGLVDLGIIPDGDERVPIHVTDVRIGADFAIRRTRCTTLVTVNNPFQHTSVELIAGT